MKVILTGSTGYIGQEVLAQCLANPSITSIIALTRRDLPTSQTVTNPKLKVVILNDFTSYHENLLPELEGAEACIWSLGKASIPTDEEAREISLEYTLAAAEAFNRISARRDDKKKFRFVYLSGMICERDQDKQLWYMQEHRRIRGQVETKLVSFAATEKDTFESYIMRPSMVLSKDNSYYNWTMGMLIPTVKLDVLAGTMVDIAMNGSEKQTWENADISSFRT